MDEKCFPYAIFILILGYLVPLSIIFICAILTLVKVKLVRKLINYFFKVVK